MEATVDPILSDLALKYQQLVDMKFQGIYNGPYPMPQTGNIRDVIVITRQNPLAATLQEISNSVLQTYGQRVWKGITGPEDSIGYTDYWLWVEPDFCGVQEVGFACEFQIQKCSPFPCGGGSFSHGVSIRAALIQ